MSITGAPAVHWIQSSFTVLSPCFPLPVRMEADLPWAWELLREIGTGESSVKKAVRHAKKSAATADPGGLDPDLAALVRIGGGHEKHAERALWRWVATQPWRRLLPDLYTFGCTKWQGPTKGVCAAEHSALLPHEVVARLAVACPELFQQVMGSQSSWAEFWAGEGLDEAALTVATAAANMPTVEAGAQDRGGPAHGPGAGATPTVDTGAAGGTAHGPGSGSAAGPGHTVNVAARGGTTDSSGVSVATARSSSQAGPSTMRGVTFATAPDTCIPLGMHGDDAGVERRPRRGQGAPR